MSNSEASGAELTPLDEREETAKKLPHRRPSVHLHATRETQRSRTKGEQLSDEQRFPHRLIRKIQMLRDGFSATFSAPFVRSSLTWCMVHGARQTA